MANGMKVKDIFSSVDNDVFTGDNGQSVETSAELYGVTMSDERWFDLYAYGENGAAVVSMSERDALRMAQAIIARVAKTAQRTTNYKFLAS